MMLSRRAYPLFPIFFLTLLTSLPSSSQPPLTNAYPCLEAPAISDFDPQWRCLGPTGQPQGRGNHIGNGQMNGLRFDPRYHAVPPNSAGYGRVYTFSPTGGLWRSEDEGQRWEVVAAVDTQLPAINIADLAVSRQEPRTLFVATGDGDHSYRLVVEPYRGLVVNPVYSAGVFRSVDDGANWERLGLPGAFVCEDALGAQLVRIEAHPENADILFVLSAQGGLWRTRNALAPAGEVRWELLLSEEQPFERESGWRGLAFRPGAPSTMYASGRRIYRSRDGGDSWELMPGLNLDSLYKQEYDDGFCEAAQRECPEKYEELCSEKTTIPRHFKPYIINLAVSPAAPERLYAYLLAEEKYRKKRLGAGRGPERCREFGQLDTRRMLQLWMWDGEKWHLLQDKTEWGMTPSRMAVAASPVEAENVFYGVVNLSGTGERTTLQKLLSGQAFLRQAASYTSGYHVDVHALAFEPNTSEPQLFVAHDGGISVREPGTGELAFRNEGLQTNLLWTFDHFERPNEQLLEVIGTQDCGTYLHRRSSETGEPFWMSIGGGDGYGAQIDDRSGTIYLHENYSVSRYDPFTGRKTGEVSKKLNGDRTLLDFRPLDPTTGDKAWIPNAFKVINHPESGNMIWGLTELFERFAAQPEVSLRAEPTALWRPLTDAGKERPPQWKRRVWEFDICEAAPDYMYLAHSGAPEYDVPPALYRSLPGGCSSEDLQAEGLRCVEAIPLDVFPDTGPLGIDFPIITSVCVHPENPHKVWITFAGFQPNYKVWSWTWDPAAGRGVWADEASATLNNLPVNGMVCQKGPEERLYIATDAGVYYKEKGMEAWVKYGNLPNVRCTEVRIHYCSGKLRVATFGRGLWEGDLLPYENLGAATELVVRDKQIWTEARGLTRNLRIADGGELVLRAPLGMPKQGELIVEPGGALIIEEGGEVLNYCGQPWRGISPVEERNFWQWLLGKKARVVGD